MPLLSFWSFGNIISSIGAILFILCAFVKRKEIVLSLHCMAHTCYMISEIITHLWAGMVQDFVSLLRNATIIFKKNTKLLNIIFIVLSVVIGIGVNILTRPEGAPFYGVWYGYFAVIANLEFSIVALYFSGPKPIKLAQGFSGILWGVNFFFGGLTIAGILNAINGLASFVAFAIMVYKDKRVRT